LPAVCGPPNGSVNPLVTAPTTQKASLAGAYSTVPKKLPAPVAASCEVDSRYAATAGPAVVARTTAAARSTASLCLMVSSFLRFMGSRRGEHRHRWPILLGRLEGDAHGLADADRVEVAVDDVGHHRGTLGERDVGDRVGD